MSYSIRIRKAAQKSLARLSQPHQDRIVAAIRDLREEPRPPGCKKLSGREAWRIRVGDYRIIYEIQDNELIVVVVLVGHRRDIYQSRH
ncbi:type II toxin-antitoxin system RelE family toxin [Thiocystis violascens]|uniref:Cytotoxic translational repressor of toxin-antitoxin stability system n=1 Tax=Thiocystis violascens (strain ATCC 17096 / DSM 198 / 6111) TaxID=765911 RepID=I3Y967_THIV6|nr:type II toxin-antitoxin system RelE/ParE family toxin [Thiocystis violascens]AFL73535.1 cytotoxic translational repressor of toxin-antitoxin stability system [Thiocystis violascens DSM 198]